MDKAPLNASASLGPGRIFTARGRRVILDSDLAKLYGVATKRLNERVRRNPQRFPADFAFLLSSTEWEAVRAQISASSGGRAQYRRFLPYAFTEHGALMAAGLLNSPRAIEVSIYIARASVIWVDG
jgi:ORF6N domain-containing protein